MLKHGLIQELNATEQFFNNSIASLSSDDALYRPDPNLYTVTAHIDHVADSITWFIDGAFNRADGFDLNFEAMIASSSAKTDFDLAKQDLAKAFNHARSTIEAQDDASLTAPIPEGPIMGGAPKLAVVGGIVDHTAHHRGCLAVYARLLGKVPAMPYGDDA